MSKFCIPTPTIKRRIFCFFGGLSIIPIAAYGAHKVDIIGTYDSYQRNRREKARFQREMEEGQKKFREKNEWESLTEEEKKMKTKSLAEANAKRLEEERQRREKAAIKHPIRDSIFSFGEKVLALTVPPIAMIIIGYNSKEHIKETLRIINTQNDNSCCLLVRRGIGSVFRAGAFGLTFTLYMMILSECSRKSRLE